MRQQPLSSICVVAAAQILERLPGNPKGFQCKLWCWRSELLACDVCSGEFYFVLALFNTLNGLLKNVSALSPCPINLHYL